MEQHRGGVDVVFDSHALEIDLPADRTPDFALNNFEYDPLEQAFPCRPCGADTEGPYSFPVTGTPRDQTHRTRADAQARKRDDYQRSRYRQFGSGRTHQCAVISDISQLIGRELRHDTDSGEILHSQDVVPPRQSKRGASSRSRSKRHSCCLRHRANRCRTASQGDVVRVVNTQSSRVDRGHCRRAGHRARHRLAPRKWR